MKRLFFRAAQIRVVGIIGIIVAGLIVAAIWVFLPGSRTGKSPRREESEVSRPATQTSNMIFIDTDSGGFFVDAYEFPNREGVKPETITTLQEAREACAGVGKRLCTDAEWRRACLGPEGKNTYGYGAGLNKGRCNSGERLESGHSGMVDPDGYRLGVWPSDALSECRTEEGVFDMVGNMEEWVLSSWQGLGGNLEGGAWFTVDEYASCTGAYSRQPHYIIELERQLFTAGTRCCWSADAPTEEDLSPIALAEDSTRRLKEAKDRSSKRSYDPKNEVQVSPGLWIDRYEYPNLKGEHPLVAVSWKEAQRSCHAAGKRLCKVAEWELACGARTGLHPYDHHDVHEQPPPRSPPPPPGSPGFDHSVGGIAIEILRFLTSPGVVHGNPDFFRPDGPPPPPPPGAPGHDRSVGRIAIETLRFIKNHLVFHRKPNRFRPDVCAILLDRPSESGKFSECSSPCGAMDMVGGVWEWTANKLEKPSGVYKGNIILREVRGGSWLSVPGDGTCRPRFGFPAASQDAVFPDVGFRCCRGEATDAVHALTTATSIDCPASMVAIGDFCIDRYEYPNQAGKTPRGHLSYQDAVSLCRSRGVHLCSEREWMLACAGRSGRRWPYGEEYSPGACRHGQTGNEGPSPIAASGFMSDCKTPERVYDLSGNLWEWTNNKRREITLRGGGTSFNALFGQCTAATTPKSGFSAFDTGARCCASSDELENIDPGGRAP